MIRVVVYSVLLIVGMVFAWTVEMAGTRAVVETLTIVCLAYIMLEVGLEFTINKKKLGSYGKDYLIAATAAGFPWIFCSLYFYWFFGENVKEALLLGRFAAPTSAGVLFAMLGAAGLGTTWLFKKARILAIFDDLDTILLMIPLQMLAIGWKWQLLLLLPIVGISIVVAYIWLHRLRWPITPWWLLLYSLVLVLLTQLFYWSTTVHIEVLLPAFLFGCVLYNPLDPHHPEAHRYAHEHIEPEEPSGRYLDQAVKNLFMFMVGASLPKVTLDANGWGWTALHVVIITILSNLGKMFPSLCYRNEASVRERLALSIAMFPRGEVGAGVLLVTLTYGFAERAVTVAALSLALNLILTGFFIWAVLKLIGAEQTLRP